MTPGTPGRPTVTSPMNETRRTIGFDELKRMLPQQVDALPGPVEFRCVVGRGKKAREVRVRKAWVGMGWVDEGAADGTEPLLVVG